MVIGLFRNEMGLSTHVIMIQLTAKKPALAVTGLQLRSKKRFIKSRTFFEVNIMVDN